MKKRAEYIQYIVQEKNGGNPFGKEWGAFWLWISEDVCTVQMVHVGAVYEHQPVIYLKGAQSEAEPFLKSIIRTTEVFFSSLSCYCWNRAQHCSFTNDSHCQTDGTRERRKKSSSFLKPLSILFSLFCSAAPQYSLKSFRGTSQAFVKCIFGVSSLERCLHYPLLLHIIHICTVYMHIHVVLA